MQERILVEKTMTSTAQQVRLLMKYSRTHKLLTAAALAAMSVRTARRYLNRREPPKSRKPRDYRTRPDPFANVWHEVENLLKADSGLEAKTLLEWLMERYPDQYHPGQLRTLQRRVKDWRIFEGPPSKEVFFPQEILPGKQSQSDFTWCNELEVTIAGAPFPHLLYHFMLPYSRWEFVCIVASESFDALSCGYDSAVRELGAVAVEHRTDNLAAAVPIGQRKVFQRRWKDFLAHYGVQPSANNPGMSNENGSVEKSHHLLKSSLDQKLRLRGSRDFGSVGAYENFLREFVHRRNRQRIVKFTEEFKLLRELPLRSWKDPREMTVTVSAWSTIAVLRALYSVPSRFIGSKLRVLVYKDSVQVFYGTRLIQEMPRVGSGEKSINYRHIIAHLLRKPGAFAQYQFREELFPGVVFRRAFDRLKSELRDQADREYLKLLNLAALNSEHDVANALDTLLAADQIPDESAVKHLTAKKVVVPEITVNAPDLRIYDSLIGSTKEDISA